MEQLGTAKEIWLVRHAESEANAGLPTTDPYTIPLTAKGQQQAIAFAKKLKRRPQLVIMTPHLRTQQTAKPVIDKFMGITTSILPLQEYQFIAQEHCTMTTVAQRKPYVNAYWQRCQPHYVQGYGAESFVQFKARIGIGLTQLAQSPANFILVFAHGHVIRAIWQACMLGHNHADRTSMLHYRDHMEQVEVSNATAYKLSYANGNWHMHGAIDPGTVSIG